MILVDFHQTILAHILANYYSDPNYILHEDSLRLGIFKALKRYRQKFYKEYGELVICGDGKDTWRKKAFPYYKARRAEDKKDSDIDWESINVYVEKLKKEIKELTPITLIQLDIAEADDIIATLVFKQFDKNNLIVSRDKDMIQLLIYEGVKQYSPIDSSFKKDVFIEEADPKKFLFEHVCRGDDTDGIPNILSPDDSFVNHIRQKPIYSKKINEWFDDRSLLPENSHFKRNRLLIDFSYIPPPVMEGIAREYLKEKDKYQDLFEYFSNHIPQLRDSVQDFV